MILRTSSDPLKAADEMCNLHLIEAAVEYPKLLSMAHRRNDGFGPLWVKHEGNDAIWWEHATDTLDRNGKQVRLTGYILLSIKRGYEKDPELSWVRETASNYEWLYRSWVAVLRNYRKAMGKAHEYEKLLTPLAYPPKNIKTEGVLVLKEVAPELRHIQPEERAYQAHVNAILSTAPFSSATLPTVRPEGIQPPKKRDAVPSFTLPGKKPCQ